MSYYCFDKNSSNTLKKTKFSGLNAKLYSCYPLVISIGNNINKIIVPNLEKYI